MYHIVMVTGKGGVGKSFTAALLAAQIAREGRKTLLVEMGPWSFLEKALDLAPRKSHFNPFRTDFGFDHAVWSGEDCLTDYVKYLVKVPWAAEAFLNNAWLRSLIKVAPGLREISFLGKITSQVRKHGPPMNYDTIVVDAVSSGHFLNLLRTPKGLMEITQVGPLREQSQEIFSVLNNPQLFHSVIVSNLESFSVQETLELVTQHSALVKSQYSLVANKIFPIPDAPSSFDGNSQGVNEFISQQLALKEYQSNQIEILSRSGAPIHKVDFSFQPLKEILKNDHRKLFTGF